MIYKHDKYPGVSENGVYPLDNFSIYGRKNDNPLEIFELGISDFSMKPSGSRSVVLWDRSADAKLRRGGRRRHDLNSRWKKTVSRWRDDCFFCCVNQLLGFHHRPNVPMKKQLLVSKVEKCSLKNARGSFFGIPDNPQVEKSRRCGPFGLEIGSQRTRQDNVISYFHSQLTGKSTPEQAPGEKPSSVHIFFGGVLRSGVPQIFPNWTILVLQPIVLGTPFFRQTEICSCFSFSSGLWNFDSRNEPRKLAGWKVENKNPEQVSGTVYKTIAWFPSEFYLQPVPTTKKGVHWPWPRDWSGPVVGSQFFFFFWGPSAAFLAGGGWDQW